MNCLEFIHFRTVGRKKAVVLITNVHLILHNSLTILSLLPYHTTFLAQNCNILQRQSLYNLVAIIMRWSEGATFQEIIHTV